MERGAGHLAAGVHAAQRLGALPGVLLRREPAGARGPSLAAQRGGFKSL